MPSFGQLAPAVLAGLALVLQGCSSGGSGRKTETTTEAPTTTSVQPGNATATSTTGSSPATTRTITSSTAARTSTSTTAPKTTTTTAHVTPSGPSVCLCLFDIDRTLTAKHGEISCPGVEVLPDVLDDGYGPGPLTLSQAGRSLAGTFCGQNGCYVGVISAGAATGPRSKMREALVQHLSAGGGKLPSREWSGPSSKGGPMKDCRGQQVDSTLVVGCVDGTKQHAVEGMVSWLEAKEHVTIHPQDVHFYDDRLENVRAFAGTGFNARQISCARSAGGLGICGAETAEIVEASGVHGCGSSEGIFVV